MVKAPAQLSVLSGRNGLVVKVTDSWPAGHEFEPSTAEDPPCRGSMHAKSVDAVGGVWKIGERVLTQMSSSSLKPGSNLLSSSPKALE
ncbi:hypothetical protein TNCV_1833341 [Trichonephila clavipes]|nr:hypothetical protein TNCV_1833341 [Trichonephila clavipes]